ncbi:SCO family protein [Nocardioides sp. SYSU D00065]|uniref:SCO family protein n=1 Tax=Nocardioides sp. SYSU D00065 TaxID=2817378 RepID=UPI001B33D555|nr:SCO family protein [Nocardioides sp. SYSU D00065]
MRVARALASVALLGLLAACGGQSGDADASIELTGTVLDPPFEVSPTPLVDTDGASYSLTEDTDKDLTLVFFGYTNCPDICGQVMATLAGTLARLDDAQKERLDVVFVTTDPARDTRAVVEDYVDAFDPSIIGLTGDLDEIVEVASSMKVAIGYFDAAGTELDPNDLPKTYDVDHGTQVFGIGADDGVDTFWGSDVSQAQLAQDVTMILDQG